MLLGITVHVIRTRGSRVARRNTVFLGAMFFTVTVTLLFSLLFAVESNSAFSFMAGMAAQGTQ